MTVQALSGRKWGVITEHLRLLTDSDWIVEVAGVKVRAKEIELGALRVWFNDSPDTFPRDEAPAMREFLAAKGVPIMPFGYKK